MAVGRITGPLLKANLLREGVPLAFETDLLYIDVINGRVGVKTSAPQFDLDVNGTTRTTNLQVDTTATVGVAGLTDVFTISGNTIASTNGTIYLQPTGANAVVYQAKLQVNSNLQITTNTVSTTVTDADLNISTLGTGKVNVNSNMLVNGNLHATGTITADGNIQLGNATTDNVVFNADVNSNIIPDVTNTYNLGSDPATGGNAWKTAFVQTLDAVNLVASSITISGVNLVLPQGNIVYVATTGSDTNAGVHEHNPVLTIKKALTLATSGTTVYIYPGTYTEIFPLTIPVGVTVKGAGIRSVTVQPTAGTIDKDAFLLNGETTVEDITVSGFRFNAGANTGYAFRFASNLIVTTRSPYIRNTTVLTRGSVVSVGDPYGFDQNDAGKGVLADGSEANSTSKEASMLFHSVTFFTPNQEAVVATNGVRIEWLNSFSYFAEKGFYAYSSAAGFAGAGLTRLRIDTRVGTFAPGNTLNYYDTNGTTVLATGTIASVVGNYVNLTGRALGFETITDRVGKTVYAQGNAKLATAQKKFGTASLALGGTGDYASVASTSDFTFGTSDFTFEGWVYRNNLTGIQVVFEFRTSGSTVAPVLYFNAGSLVYQVGATIRITVASGVTVGSWFHIAASRSAGSTRIFRNGTQIGPTYTDANNYVQSPLFIGSNLVGASSFNGYIDDVRITKGVAKYTANFAAPTQPLTSDNNTVLLLHFDGTDNSIVFVDDGFTQQDIRTSAGGTASIIQFADYSDFGAEIRSIGSASVYGTYGVYGDGIGVIGYFISHNVAYVGAGKLITNDPNDRIAANEFVQLNGAKIYHTSVDNEGNFTVGSNFSINQKTGDVVFNGENLTVTSLNGVTFTDGVNTTTITSTDITTGNIRIHDNNIDSLTGAINVSAASGAINLQNNTYVTGNLNVTGDVNIGGNITIGDQSTDTVNFVGKINSSLIPATTAFYDLGTIGLRWKTAFLNRAEIDSLVIDNNTISTTNANDDLQLIANGTGRVYIPSNDVQIDQNLTVTQNLTVSSGVTSLKNTTIVGTITQTGDINQTGNFVTSGNTQVTGNITGTGYVQLPEIRISGNTISTTTSNRDLQLVANGGGDILFEGIRVSNNTISSTVTNSNITLTPQGTGGVVVNSNQSIQIPVGTTAQRPGVGVATNGMIRYNTDLSRYEGYSAGYWTKLGGVEDVDGNTKILAEATPGANDNTLYFYADGVLTATIDSTKLFATQFQTVNLAINSNTIAPILTNSDINLTTTGTGGVRMGNFKIFNNSITNIVSGAVTEFNETGTGYVRIAGVNGVVIPSGNTLTDRPLVPEVGMMRFNTDGNLVEVYNGVTWGSVAGNNSGVTAAEANDIGIFSALILG